MNKNRKREIAEKACRIREARGDIIEKTRPKNKKNKMAAYKVFSYDYFLAVQKIPTEKGGSYHERNLHCGTEASAKRRVKYWAEKGDQLWDRLASEDN